ncbi:MAG: metal-dependent hydrolase [Flavobacteriales bacterium]|nr:metal-dependent hydrolase [Flavobacteriales bacterium]
MNITYFGHACFLLETSKAKILFDPFISPNELAKEIDVEAIECDYVLLSHGHEDHIADAESILKRTHATLVSNFEIVSWYEGKGIKNTHPMNIGGAWKFDFGWAKYVYASHSSVMPDGTYGGNPGGWMLEVDNKVIYYAGDTGLNTEMRLLGERYAIDWAILPIGDNFTMGPVDATKASDFLNCPDIIGMHFDTFGYIQIDHESVKDLFAKTRKNLTLMEIGATKEL